MSSTHDVLRAILAKFAAQGYATVVGGPDREAEHQEQKTAYGWLETEPSVEQLEFRQETRQLSYIVQLVFRRPSDDSDEQRRESVRDDVEAVNDALVADSTLGGLVDHTQFDSGIPISHDADPRVFAEYNVTAFVTLMASTIDPPADPTPPLDPPLNYSEWYESLRDSVISYWQQQWSRTAKVPPSHFNSDWGMPAGEVRVQIRMSVIEMGVVDANRLRVLSNVDLEQHLHLDLPETTGMMQMAAAVSAWSDASSYLRAVTHTLSFETQPAGEPMERIGNVLSQNIAMQVWIDEPIT